MRQLESDITDVNTKFQVGSKFYCLSVLWSSLRYVCCAINVSKCMFILMYLTMTLLQDLASVLHEQGDIVDSIVSNIETTSVMVATEHGLQLVHY